MPSLPNDPTTRKGWPQHRGLRPLPFSESGVNHDVCGTRPCLRHIVSTMCLVIPCPRFLFFCNVCLLFTKTSKKQRGQERTTVRCHLDAIFKFKMLAERRSKKFFWLMISIYEICKSHAKSFARIESAWCVKKYYGVKTALQCRGFFGTLEFAGVEVLQSRKAGHISSFLLNG